MTLNPFLPKIFLGVICLGLLSGQMVSPIPTPNASSNMTFMALAPAEFEDCTTVDLRPTLPPVRDQGDSGWCFANSAADIVSQKVRINVSATDVAITFLLGNARALYEHKSPLMQQYLAHHPGFFRELYDARMSEPKNTSPSRILGENGLLDTGGEEDLAIMMMNTKGLCVDGSIPSGGWEKLGKDLKTIRAAWRKKIPPSGPIEGPYYQPMIGAIADPIAREMARRYQEFVDQRCQRVNVPGIFLPRVLQAGRSIDEVMNRVKSSSLTWGKVHTLMMNEVNWQLNQGHAVAVGYDARDIIVRTPGDTPGDHSSLIVARKPINGVCHYFIRNAWGRSCTDYQVGLRFLCEAAQGGLWVPDTTLKTVYSAISLQ